MAGTVFLPASTHTVIPALILANAKVVPRVTDLINKKNVLKIYVQSGTVKFV